jgi:acid phosphatase
VNVVISGDEKQLNDTITPPDGIPGNCLLGQLTDHGKTVMAKLGSLLKSIYFDGLGFQVAAHEIHLRSTNTPRTIQSLSSLLSGLFPRNESSISADKLPVLIRDEYLEDMYGSMECHKYHSILTQHAEQFARENAANISNLHKSLPNIFHAPNLYGQKPSTYEIFDILSSRQEHNLPLPKKVDNSTMGQLERLATNEFFTLFNQSKEATSLAVGRFLREIDANLYRKDRKLCVYSAHDSTIAPLLGAFSVVMGPKSPPFAAHCTLELFETVDADKKPDGKSYVRILYQNRPIILPHCAEPGNHHPRDPSLCKLQSFSESVRRFIPQNYLEECKASL